MVKSRRNPRQELQRAMSKLDKAPEGDGSPKIEFFGLDLDGVKSPGAKVSVPTEKGLLISTNLGTPLAWVIDGDLTYFEDNRGDGQYSKKTAALARQGVDESCLGLITIGEWEGRMRLCDCQSRIFGFLERHIAGEMTRAEYNIPVPVKVTHDFLNSYRGLNGADTHKHKHKFKNKCLLYGNEWEKVKAHLSDECIRMVGDSRWTVISSLIYSFSEIERDSDKWFFPYVYNKRGAATQRSNDLPSRDVRLTNAQANEFAMAVQYWHELMLNLKADAGKVNVNPIVGSAGFFGFIVTAKLGVDKVLPTRMPTLTNRILKHLQDVVEIAPVLCRGKKTEVLLKCTHLSRMLGMKSKAA